MDIATKLTDLIDDLHYGRRAVTYRGGTISARAGFKELFDEVINLPASSSVGTVINESASLLKVVPNNSTKYCYLKSLGGMTYRDEENNTLIDTKSTAIKVHGANFIKFPYYSPSSSSNGLTITVNNDRSITFNGTPESQVIFIVTVNSNLLSDTITHYVSGNCITENWPDGITLSTSVEGRYSPVTNSLPSRTLHLGNKITDMRFIVYEGTVCDNVTFQPMVNIGTTARPYVPYHEPITYPIPEALRGTGKGIDSTYHDTVNFENGKAITEIGEILMKNLSWTIADYDFYSYSLRDKFIGNNLLCDAYTTKPWVEVYNGGTDRCIAGNGSAIILSDTRYTDIASFRASLTDEKLMYATTTPTSTDIDTSAFDPLIEVEPGGSIEFITDSGYAPNSTVVFQTIL